MVCFHAQEMTLGEKIVERLRKLAKTLTTSKPKSSWYVVSATVAIGGQLKGFVTMAKARTLSEAVRSVAKAARHSLIGIFALETRDPVADCWQYESHGFIPLEDLPPASFFRCWFAQTSYQVHVLADCEESAELIARATGDDLADGPCVVFAA